jgi:hypothetical protein
MRHIEPYTLKELLTVAKSEYIINTDVDPFNCLEDGRMTHHINGSNELHSVDLRQSSMLLLWVEFHGIFLLSSLVSNRIYTI